MTDEIVDAFKKQLTSLFALAELLPALDDMTVRELRERAQGAAHREPKPAAVAAAPKSARLMRRTPEDIENVVKQITRLLASHPDGIGAEDIRKALNLEKNEIGRPIADALKGGAIRKEGLLRATKYFLAAPEPPKSAPVHAVKKRVKK